MQLNYGTKEYVIKNPNIKRL